MTNDEYEFLAACFRRDIGLMAPGKDAPPGMYTEQQDVERRERWQAWCAGAYGLRAVERWQEKRAEAFALVERELRSVSDNRVIVTLDPSAAAVGWHGADTLMEALDATLKTKAELAKESTKEGVSRGR